MSVQTSPLIGLFQLNLVATTGLMGAPTFHMGLLVNPSEGRVTGLVNITQAVDPKSSASNANVNVTGTYTELVFGGQETKAIVLSGEYVYSVPPPAIGSFLCKFNAIIHLGDDWNGTGTYTWGFDQKAADVPTKEVPTLAAA